MICRSRSVLLDRRRTPLLSFVLAAVVSLAADAASAEVLTEFYLPVPENEALETLEDVDSATADAVQTFVSLVLPDDCTVYYDHWEDGYENDLTRPAQPTSLQWGNGDDGDGVPPGFLSDPGRLPGGTVLVLNNSVITGMETGDEDPNAPGADELLRSVIDFDGRDRVGTSCSSAMTRAAWASAGTLNAGAIEVWPVASWGTQYVLPIGENTKGSDEDFEIVNASIMAATDDTDIHVDHDADGRVDISITLGRGETYYLDSSRLQINEGASIQASARVQVDLLTGDEDSNWEGRWFAVLPVQSWDSCYYAPTDEQPRLGSEESGPAWVRIFLFNPGDAPLEIDAVDGHGTHTVVDVPAGSSEYYDMGAAPVGTRFCTRDGRPFYAAGSVDHGSVGHDWGYYLVPAKLLTSQLLVPWADGCDPTYEPACTQNSSPLWVVPVCDTYIYADFDQDGESDRIDLNGDGDTDDVVDGFEEWNSHRGLRVPELHRVMLHDPSGDVSQTGALVYSLAGPDRTGGLGCDLAGVWGQNAANANSGVPAIDVGTLAVPFGGNLSVEMRTNGVDAETAQLGVPVRRDDLLVWTYVVENTGDFVLENVTVHENQLPAGSVRCMGSDTEVIASLRPGESVACYAIGAAMPGRVEAGVMVLGTPVGAVAHLGEFDCAAADVSWYDAE